MLVIGRKAGEGIILKTRDGHIIVRVQKSQDGRTRLAIEAPRVVKILREELIDHEEGA
jgi:carbon storage regulator CsrA